MSNLTPFALERFFAKYEFTAPHLACCSDCEPLTMAELLDMADEEAKKMWSNLRLGYTETQGLPELRQAVASKYFKDIQAKDIVVCVPEEGIYLTMRALLNPGDHVVVTYPGYQSLYELATSIGCTVSHWEPCLGQNASVAFKMEDLEASLRPNTKMVIVNFPHNPTGVTLSQQDWQRLVELCKARDSWLFSDEMYRMLELEPAVSRLPCAADVYDKAVSLQGCSKALALPGLRLGWVACQQATLISRIMELKDYTTICSSGPSEILALISVRATDQIVQRNLDIVKGNVKAFQGLCDDYPHLLSWQPPTASSVALPRLKFTGDIATWCDKLVEAEGVLLLPSSVYGYKAAADAGHFRIGLGRKNLPECLEHLRHFLDGM